MKAYAIANSDAFREGRGRDGLVGVNLLCSAQIQ